MGKTLGETNGKWLIAFKVGAILIPTTLASIIGLLVWIVTSKFEADAERGVLSSKIVAVSEIQKSVSSIENQLAVIGQWMKSAEDDRFRRRDALALEVKVQERITKIWQAIGELPPDEFEERVNNAIADIAQNKQDIAILKTKVQ